AANIPARYVYGTIELPIEKAMNWVGVKDPYTAAQIFASGGIPSKAITFGGKIVAIQMEHVWTEIYIPYMPDEGVTSRGQKIWIPVDPSFKQYEDKEAVDLASAIGFDGQAFYNEVKAQSTTNPDGSVVVNEGLIKQKMEENLAKLSNYLDANFPGTPTLFDVLGYRKIIKQEFGLLLGSLPYKPISVLNRYSEISDNLRHKVSFTIEGASYIASLPELASKRITVSYIGASEEDRNFLKNYSSIEDVPAYLVQMKPLFMVDGKVKFEGSSIMLGEKQSFTMGFTSPNGPSEQITNDLTAGAYYAVGIDLQKIPRELIAKLHANLQAIVDMINAGEGLLLPDDLLGELLWGIAQTYWCELDATNKVVARMLGISSIRYPSEGMVFTNLSTSYVFGIPEKVNLEGLSIDIDRDLESPFAKDGNLNKRTTYVIQSGMNGSMLEHSIFEQMLKIESVSAVKIMQIANSQGIPVYQLTKDNISQVLPILQVSSDVKSDLQDSINAGKVVTIPRSNITYNGWNGIGYIILDPDTGAGAYMISGGLAGGGTTNDANWKLMEWFFETMLVIALMLAPYEEIPPDFRLIYGARIISILLPIISAIDVINKLPEKELSEDAKKMITWFVIGVAVFSEGLIVGSWFLGPHWVAISFLISMSMSFVISFVIPYIIDFGIRHKNYLQWDIWW
ncbi:MAG: hypothetical protein AB1630_11575, partial [bacterium]